MVVVAALCWRCPLLSLLERTWSSSCDQELGNVFAGSHWATKSFCGKASQELLVFLREKPTIIVMGAFPRPGSGPVGCWVGCVPGVSWAHAWFCGVFGAGAGSVRIQGTPGNGMRLNSFYGMLSLHSGAEC